MDRDSLIHAFEVRDPDGGLVEELADLSATADAGALLAVGGINDEATVSVWRGDDPTRVTDFPLGAHVTRPREPLEPSLRASPDGLGWAVVTDRATIELLGVGGERRSLAHEGQVGSLSFSADGSRLAAASRSVVRVYGVTTGELLGEARVDPDVARRVTLSSDGRRLWVETQASLSVTLAVTR